MNVYELIRERRNHLPEDKIMILMYQLLKGGTLLNKSILPVDDILANFVNITFKVDNFFCTNGFQLKLTVWSLVGWSSH